jgi:hypothetical protein
MTFHPERYIGLCFLLLMLTVVAPPAADWWRTASQLPSGYGAEGDQQRASRIPPLACPTVEYESDDPEGSWVGESVEDGKPSGDRIASDANGIPPNVSGPHPGGTGVAGE